MAGRLPWKKRIQPSLDEADSKKARVYFPVAEDLASMRSTLGRARCTDLEHTDGEFYKALLAFQPFETGDDFLKQVREIANAKHRGLIPQKRTEERRVNVHTPGGGRVSWGPGVSFGSGVSIGGVPIDPRTQLPVPNNIVRTEVETWVSFNLEGTGLNALGFCERAVKETQAVVDALADQLNF